MNDTRSSEGRCRVPVEALRKGLDLLDLLSGPGGEGLSLALLAERMSLKRSTTHNLLKTLCLCGYAENVGEGRYRAGWKARQLGRLMLLDGRADRGIVDGLGAVAAALGEAAVLAVLVDGRRRVVARAAGTQAIRIDTEAVDSAYGVIWKTVTGRVLAAWCSAAERARVLAVSGLPGADAWPAATTSASLASALEAIRGAGFAEHTEAGVASFAVPVRSGNGGLLAALGTHLPEFRCEPQRRLKLLETLRLGATELAAVLTGASAAGVPGVGDGVGHGSPRVGDPT